MLMCSSVHLNYVLQLDKIISSPTALLAHAVTETSGTDLLWGDRTKTIALILRNKATVFVFFFIPVGKRHYLVQGSSSGGCYMVSLQRCASYHLSSFPLPPDFTATAWESLFLFWASPLRPVTETYSWSSEERGNAEKAEGTDEEVGKSICILLEERCSVSGNRCFVITGIAT